MGEAKRNLKNGICVEITVYNYSKTSFNGKLRGQREIFNGGIKILYDQNGS